MTDESGGNSNPLTLRERRRLETVAEINSAALSLFESRGVDATTVADIAASAGVSQRTFFRYFETKELAALTEDIAYNDALEAWADSQETVDDPFQSMLDAIEDATRIMSTPASRDRQLRLRKLVRTEPQLRLAFLRRSAEHSDHLRQALARRHGGKYSDHQLSVLSRLADAILEESVMQWMESVEAGGDSSMADEFAQTRRFVVTAFAALA